MTDGLLIPVAFVIALGCPQVMSGGYGWIQSAVNGAPDMTVRLMLILIFAKIVATSFTISSGGSGGVFAPSLFMGAALGGMVGAVLGAASLALMPELAPGTPLALTLGPGPVGWAVLLLAVPAVTAAIAWATARHSVRLLLRQMY